MINKQLKHIHHWHKSRYSYYGVYTLSVVVMSLDRGDAGAVS